MATAPTPPEPPNGGVWVELHRGLDTNGDGYIFYESEDGEASVELTLKSDGKRRYLEWGIVEWIKGLGRLREASDAQRSDPPMSVTGEDERRVPVRHTPETGTQPEAASRYQSSARTPPAPVPHSPQPGPVPDPQYLPPSPPPEFEPAPGSLMDGVPERERKRFTSWLNG